MKIPKQTITGNLLQQTGISQRSLATFLEIDHSLLSHYDKGNRSLPSAALLQLLEMASLLQKATALPASLVTEIEKEDLQKHANRCRVKRDQLQIKLEAMQAIQQKAATALQMVNALNGTANLRSEIQQLWLNLEARKASIKLKHNGWLNQRRLEIAIELLEKEAALYESMANLAA